MSTYGAIVSAILDDIDDTQGEYREQAKAAVLAAIRYCERTVYYFNETRDVVFNTSNAQEWYDSTSAADIATLVRITAVYLERDGGQRVELHRETPEAVELLNETSSSHGEPSCWTYFGQRIRFHPIPDQAYAIRLQLGPYRLATLTDDDDATNAWLTEAYDMVKARAKYILAKDTLKDAAKATEAIGDYGDQETSLKAETSRRNGRGLIMATTF